MRYPVNEQGLIVSPYELGLSPPEREDFKFRRTTNHHGYWTRAQYGKTAIHSTFRNLEEHVYPLNVDQHRDLHDKFSPPKMPPVGLMIDVLDEYMVVNGVINVVREKATNEIREIDLAAWNQIRQTYNIIK
jgi:hypothetical protein